MKRRLETLGYVLCFKLATLRVDRGWPWGWVEIVWTGIWYRYYCPYPIGDHEWTARACIKAGWCGCTNGTALTSAQGGQE